MAYTSKIISLEAALALVKSGDTIVTGLGAAEAGLFMENIHTIADRVKDVKIVNCNPTHQCSFYAPEYVDSFRVDGWFYATPMRKAHEQGNMAYIPNNLHFAATSGSIATSPTYSSPPPPCRMSTATSPSPPPAPTSGR